MSNNFTGTAWQLCGVNRPGEWGWPSIGRPHPAVQLQPRGRGSRVQARVCVRGEQLVDANGG
jgi:hypothetical protein